jgi:hypothetical protein
VAAVCAHLGHTHATAVRQRVPPGSVKKGTEAYNVPLLSRHRYSSTVIHLQCNRHFETDGTKPKLNQDGLHAPGDHPASLPFTAHLCTAAVITPVVNTPVVNTPVVDTPVWHSSSRISGEQRNN